MTPLLPFSALLIQLFKTRLLCTLQLRSLPFFQAYLYHFFFTEEWRSYIFDEPMQGVFAKPSLGICSSVPWKARPLGNNKEFRATAEAYFPNIV